MNLTNPNLQLVVQWFPVLAITLLFYVLVMGPMRKRQKAVQQMVENLKKGDRVVTNGGMYGEIAAVTGATVILKIADNVKVKIAKSAITGLDAEGEKGGAS